MILCSKVCYEFRYIWKYIKCNLFSNTIVSLKVMTQYKHIALKDQSIRRITRIYFVKIFENSINMIIGKHAFHIRVWKLYSYNNFICVIVLVVISKLT